VFISVVAYPLRQEISLRGDGGQYVVKKVYALLVVAATVLSSLHLAHAQNQASTPRMGILSGGERNANLDLFLQRLRELGHYEGKNIEIEYRFASGHPDRLPGLAKELVQLKPDAIFALKPTTNTIPIVFFSTSDPVGMGVVSSLAHPGGNFTGISALASGLWQNG